MTTVAVPECKFCNVPGEPLGPNTVFLQAKYAISKAGKPFCCWSCPNSCKDENGNYNRHEPGFLTNDQIRALVDDDTLPAEASACIRVNPQPSKAPAKTTAAAARPNPWTKPMSNVNVNDAADLSAGVLGKRRATTSIEETLVKIIEMAEEALAEQRSRNNNNQ